MNPVSAHRLPTLNGIDAWPGAGDPATPPSSARGAYLAALTVPFGRPGDADRAAAGTVVLPGADSSQSRTARPQP